MKGFSVDFVSSSQLVNGLRALVATVRMACFAGALLILAAPLCAADRAAEFLDGLRQRGWHDVALDYLDRADEDPLATPEFLDRIDFERAATLAALAKQEVGDKRRSALLEQATAGFQQFAQSHPKSPFTIEALSQAGKLLTEQALIALGKAERLPKQATSARNELFATARQLLDQADATAETLLEACDRKLRSLPVAAALQQDAAARDLRQTLRTKQAEAKFLRANLSFEKARTYPNDSDQHAKTLAEAAKKFAQLAKQYEGKVVGFYGRLYQGRCHQTAGEIEAALKCYDDLVSQPSGDATLRSLIARAYRRRAECHLASGNIDQAIQECRDWLNDAHGEERRQAEWLAVAFQLASAYQAKAEQTSARGEANRLQAEARKLFREVSRQPGEFQSRARATIASVSQDNRPIAAKTFDEAFAAGKDALEQMNSSKLAAKLAAENNPEAVEELQQQAKINKTTALGYFEKSLDLAKDTTPIEQLVATRYYLCWLYWEDGRLEDAAAMGESLARQHPQSRYAPTAAKLALAAYEQLHLAAQKNKGAETEDPEKKRLADIAEFIIQRWPDSDEAATAVNLLINIALADNRLADAEQLLEQLPENQRTAAALNLGGSMWIRYLQTSTGDSAAASEQAVQWKQRAGELLSSGFESLRKQGSASAAQVTDVLYLVQLLLAQGEFKRAVEVLEDPSVGPLAWIDKRSGADQRPGFAREAYKAGLRAYVSVEPPQRDKAQQMMEALENSLGGQADAQRQLTNIYVGLGLQLQRQINELSRTGETAKAAAVAASFEDLIARVTQRGGASDWKVRNWIAQTNLQLGAGLQGDDAARYLQQAEQAYRDLLAEVEKDASFAPSELAVLGVRKRLGDCLSAQQKYEEAFSQYTKILAEKPNLLELQQATAAVLQQWGRATQNPEKLEQAIRGTLPQENKKNLVWGWLRLANSADAVRKKVELTAKNQPADQAKIAKYQDLFFEARYNVAKARFEAARLAQGPNGKNQLRRARKSVESMKRLYPDLGGPKWKKAFDDLLRQIEEQPLP